MGIIQKFFGSQTTSETPKTTTKSQSFSTPFFNIGKGNLSQPYVSTFYTNGIYVRFGEDNLYPQLLTQLYFQSPLHAGVVDFTTNAIIGGGYEWSTLPQTGKEKVELLTFEKRNHIKSLVKTITKDLILHARVTILMCRRENGTYYMKRVDPSWVRNDETLEKFAISPDWSRGEYRVKYVNRWHPTCKDEESLFVYQEEMPGGATYPFPSYNGALNWIALDGDIAFFHKNNLKNSVFPSIVIRRPKEFTSQDEIDDFRAMLKMKSGAKEGGSALVLTGNGFDQTPEVVFSTASDNDKLFMEVSKEIKDQIAFAHGINPAILGIKVAGSLGSKEEIEISYQIFEKNRVMPLRAQVEEIIGELLDGNNIMNGIVFKNFQIIDKEIVEKDSNTNNTI